MIEFILDELKNFDLVNVRTNAVKRGITISDTQFIADYILITRIYHLSQKKILKMQRNGTNNLLLIIPAIHIFKKHDTSLYT